MATKTRQNTNTATTAPVDTDARRQNQQVSVIAPARLPYHPIYQERYGVSGVMWRALVEAVYPSAKTVEGVILAISYCQSKGYDVMKKMVHVVPIWNSQLQKEVEGVWEAVAALRATAFRTGEYAGCDETKFGPMKSMHFEGETGRGQYVKHVEADLEFPEWAQVTVYRFIQGQRCAFPGPKVYWLAAYGCQGKSDVPNDKWQEGGGSYMLEKCAEAAALRKAFPEALGSTNAAEEMEGRKFANMAGPVIENDESAAPAPPRPTRESVRAANERTRQEQLDNEEHTRTVMRETPAHDAETWEIEYGAEESERDEGGQGPGPEADHSEARQKAPEDAGGTAARTGNKATGRSGQGNTARAQGAGESAGQSDARPQETALNPAKTRDMLLKKVMNAEKAAQLMAILTDYQEELEFLRIDAPAEYAKVMEPIAAKKQNFGIK